MSRELLRCCGEEVVDERIDLIGYLEGDEVRRAFEYRQLGVFTRRAAW